MADILIFYTVMYVVMKMEWNILHMDKAKLYEGFL